MAETGLILRTSLRRNHDEFERLASTLGPKGALLDKWTIPAEPTSLVQLERYEVFHTPLVQTQENTPQPLLIGSNPYQIWLANLGTAPKLDSRVPEPTTSSGPRHGVSIDTKYRTGPHPVPELPGNAQSQGSLEQVKVLPRVLSSYIQSLRRSRKACVHHKMKRRGHGYGDAEINDR